MAAQANVEAFARLFMPLNYTKLPEHSYWPKSRFVFASKFLDFRVVKHQPRNRHVARCPSLMKASCRTAQPIDKPDSDLQYNG